MMISIRFLVRICFEQNIHYYKRDLIIATFMEIVDVIHLSYHIQNMFVSTCEFAL